MGMVRNPDTQNPDRPKSRHPKSRNPKSRQVQNPDRYKIPTDQNLDKSKSRQVKILKNWFILSFNVYLIYFYY